MQRKFSWLWIRITPRGIGFAIRDVGEPPSNSVLFMGKVLTCKGVARSYDYLRDPNSRQIVGAGFLGCLDADEMERVCHLAPGIIKFVKPRPEAPDDFQLYFPDVPSRVFEQGATREWEMLFTDSPYFAEDGEAYFILNADLGRQEDVARLRELCELFPIDRA